MNIDRLKFAWARGARIEVSPRYDNEWFPIGVGAIEANYRNLRTPDTHLEYGPISTKLRESVLYIFDAQTHEYSPYHEMGVKWVREYIETCVDPRISYRMETIQMFILFAAEYLADQGL